MPDAQKLVVIQNDLRQVMLVSEHGWPKPLPASLSVAVLTDGLMLSAPSGYAMGLIPDDCAGGLLSAKEVHLGLIRDGRLVSSGTVGLTWDFATAGERS